MGKDKEDDVGKDVVLIIAFIEAKEAAKNESTLEGRLKAAMNATKDHWVLTDEDGRFRAAVGAALLLSDDDDQERITKEMAQLRTLSAVMSGVPINFEGIETIEKPIGLMKMWHDAKGC